VEMGLLLKVIFIFNTIPIKCPMTFFIEIENRKTNPKIHMETHTCTKSQIAKEILSKKENADFITIPEP
jgi:hypothetical protein